MLFITTVILEQNLIHFSIIKYNSKYFSVFKLIIFYFIIFIINIIFSFYYILFIVCLLKKYKTVKRNRYIIWCVYSFVSRANSKAWRKLYKYKHISCYGFHTHSLKLQKIYYANELQLKYKCT